ncbi:MAG: hypothetical protein ACFFEF_18690 [Candidatus Thorarchaeota archaeon]
MSSKVPVMVFMAVGVCGCSQTGFLGRVYDAVRKHRDYVDYKEYSADSETAKRFGIGYRGVVVGTISLGSNPTAGRIEEAIHTELEKMGIKAQ